MRALRQTLRAFLLSDAHLSLRLPWRRKSIKFIKIFKGAGKSTVTSWRQLAARSCHACDLCGCTTFYRATRATICSYILFLLCRILPGENRSPASIRRSGREGGRAEIASTATRAKRGAHHRKINVGGACLPHSSSNPAEAGAGGDTTSPVRENV